MPEIHRRVREANCKVGPRARVGAVRVDQRQGTSSEVGNGAVSSRGRGTSSCRLEGPDRSVARRTGPVHSPAVKRRRWGTFHHVSCRIGQLDAGSSGGVPECDEFGRPTSCGGSQHETGRRCFTDGLLDRWNGDVKAVPSVAEAIRHQCGLKGVRVGEADKQVACATMGLGKRFGVGRRSSECCSCQLTLSKR